MTDISKLNIRVTKPSRKKTGSKRQFIENENFESAVSENTGPVDLSKVLDAYQPVNPWDFNMECGCCDDWYGLDESTACKVDCNERSDN